MANKVKIKDEQGSQVFPITHVSAVLDNNGDNIGEIVSGKQDELVSGTNIKTVNGQSLLGSGNISIQGGSGGGGDVNVIESITFNGNNVPVDGNKNAAISYTAPVTSVNGNTGDVTLSIPSEVTDSTVSGWGFTKNAGTITGITMNSASKGTSGVVDLGTVITDISGKQDAIDSSHKLSADLVEDGTTNKVLSAAEKTKIDNTMNLSVVSGTAVTQELTPNVFYSFGGVTSLTVTLGSPVANIPNEYAFEFDSGSTATTLSIPASVVGIDATAIAASKHYEISIKYDASNQNYYGLIQEW